MVESSVDEMVLMTVAVKAETKVSMTVDEMVAWWVEKTAAWLAEPMAVRTVGNSVAMSVD